MFYLVEEREGKRWIVAEDASRADLEDFAGEYHRDAPQHGPLYFMEGDLREVRFRAVFDDGAVEVRRSKEATGSIAGDITGYLARYPTVTFTAAELAKEVGCEGHRASAVLWRLKESGRILSPERGKFQHAGNGAGERHGS
jgi:hypothetical protein